MKIAELMALGNCAICKRQQLESLMPLFYCIEISRCGFKADPIRRSAGLELLIGPLAHTLGPDEDLAAVIDGPHRVFVHETCAARMFHLLELFPEKAADDGGAA